MQSGNLSVNMRLIYFDNYGIVQQDNVTCRHHMLHGHKKSHVNISITHIDIIYYEVGEVIIDHMGKRK